MVLLNQVSQRLNALKTDVATRMDDLEPADIIFLQATLPDIREELAKAWFTCFGW